MPARWWTPTGELFAFDAMVLLSSDRLEALDAATGTELWAADLGHVIESTVLGTSGRQLLVAVEVPGDD